MPPPPQVPRATYRLQLNAGFTLRDALAVVPYLDDLGVSHLYVSSFLAARPGSLHGYDIVDHNAFNPEIGDEDDLTVLSAELERRGMGLMLDFVPNHMGIGGSDNAYWLDVMEWGEHSPYAEFFDIDWRPGRPDMRGKVLYPFLGDHYGAVLERGELVPRFDRNRGSFSVWYWDHRLPIRPADYARLLRPAQAGISDPDVRRAFDEVVHQCAGLALGRAEERASTAGRARAAAAQAALAVLVAEHPQAGAAIDAALARLAGSPGDPHSVAGLHDLLERQHYRISCWRVAAAEINYRRFFDINDLAGLRQERPAVFEATHRLVFRLIAERKVHALRIDHIDGLANPAQYCQRLQRRARDLLDQPHESDQPLYLVVEKVLAHHERLRRDWPVAGTTGYDFMNQVAGLFVDQEAQPVLDAAYAGFIAMPIDFAAEVVAAKRAITRQAMASELHVLGVQLGRLAGSHWRSRDFTIDSLREGLREVVAQFPIYRTYFTPRRASRQDRDYVAWAVAQARKGATDEPLFDFLRAVLDTSLARGRRPLYSRSQVLDFAMRLQQYSGPVMAKGFEDTALYRYNRLISLNEVGGEPRRFGLSPAAFHQAMRPRCRAFPHAMLATATHDSKRGEDVRVRLHALSELAEDWRSRVARWSRINQSLKRMLDTGPAPEANDEYFLYQTMLGAWPDDPAEVPAFIDRLAAATLKGIREAKRRTSWNDPDPAYEQATDEFVRRICDPDRRGPFLDDFLALQRRVAGLGRLNGLSQTLLKLTCPGVPDLYQGCELWQLDLVDPDNRRPVDYALRRRLLEQSAGLHMPDLLAGWQDGAVKLALTRRVLALRRAQPELFARGDYRPLVVRGERAAHVLAFARRHEDRVMVVAVPRLVARLWPEGQGRPPLGAAWRGTSIEVPQGLERFSDALSGRNHTSRERRRTAVLAVAELFDSFPVALLVGHHPLS
jgi:(1->4)-alpha-D-glucan 1-alpha-D-glucosylmutase